MRRGVYWNQAQKNFTQPYTEYPWVSVTLWPISMIIDNNLCLMHREYHEFYALHVYLRSIRISLVSINITFWEMWFLDQNISSHNKSVNSPRGTIKNYVPIKMIALCVISKYERICLFASLCRRSTISSRSSESLHRGTVILGVSC